MFNATTPPMIATTPATLRRLTGSRKYRTPTVAINAVPTPLQMA
jgi:hypothetical protein